MVDEYLQARPTPGLRSYVAHYSGYRQRGVAPALHRGLPSPYLTLILTLDEPLEIIAHPDRRQTPGRYDTLLGGLHLTHALITHDGNQSGLQVAVHPLGCRALFGLPAGELSGVDTDLAAVAGHGWVTTLRERLLTATTWPHRFAVLDDALTRRLRMRDDVHPDVAYAFDRLVTTGGEITVGALASEIGWSARHLTNRFRAEVGLRPKETARVVRFDRARRLLRTGARVGDAAADAGYFDQAHLTREFQALAGVPPTRWLADEIGFVQAVRAGRGQDEWHD